MRRILTAKQQAEGLMRNVKRRVPEAIESAKRAAIEVAKQVSPREGDSRHPYATDEFAEGWVWRGNRLVNTVEHARYTDDGFTRYGGRGSARGWVAEGSRRYSDAAADEFSRVFQETLRHTRG